jgi:hypothetical protein
MPDDDDKAWNERVAELRETGRSRPLAERIAALEARIANWPEAWGEDLHVLIYGDFDAPKHDLVYPSIGITVESGERTNTFTTARCVLSARIKIADKSVPSVLDAASRLNTLLGIWTALDRGNRGIRWWCPKISAPNWSIGGPFEKEGMDAALLAIEQLQPDVKRKVKAALYWMRQPKRMMGDRAKSDTLDVYAGYWNSFECLVDAVCLLRPQHKMTPQEKQNAITNFFADRGGKVDASSIAECYRDIVNPGFMAKAIYALRVCCPERADGYIEECFRAQPKEERLYAVRNAINHGELDADSLHETVRVEDKLWRLQRIVFAMLGRLLPIPFPGGFVSVRGWAGRAV